MQLLEPTLFATKILISAPSHLSTFFAHAKASTPARAPPTEMSPLMYDCGVYAFTFLFIAAWCIQSGTLDANAADGTGALARRWRCHPSSAEDVCHS